MDDEEDLVNVLSLDYHNFVFGMFAAYKTWHEAWQQFCIDLPRAHLVVDGEHITTTSRLDHALRNVSPSEARVLTALCTQATLAPIFEILHPVFEGPRTWFTDDSGKRMHIRVDTTDQNMFCDIDKSFLVVDSDQESPCMRVNTHIHVDYSRAEPVVLTWASEKI